MFDQYDTMLQELNTEDPRCKKTFLCVDPFPGVGVRLYIRSHTVSRGLVRSLIRSYADMTPSVSVFFTVLKCIHDFHGYTRMARM